VISSSLQEICALLGQPVAGNPTQFMIEKAFACHGLEWRYLTLEVAVEDLGDAIRGMRAMGFRGGNVTKPHKIAVVTQTRLVGVLRGLRPLGRPVVNAALKMAGRYETTQTRIMTGLMIPELVSLSTR